jgi:hypothetical protein
LPLFGTITAPLIMLSQWSVFFPDQLSKHQQAEAALIFTFPGLVTFFLVLVSLAAIGHLLAIRVRSRHEKLSH